MSTLLSLLSQGAIKKPASEKPKQMDGEGTRNNGSKLPPLPPRVTHLGQDAVMKQRKPCKRSRAKDSRPAPVLVMSEGTNSKMKATKAPAPMFNHFDGMEMPFDDEGMDGGQKRDIWESRGVARIS